MEIHFNIVWPSKRHKSRHSKTIIRLSQHLHGVGREAIEIGGSTAGPELGGAEQGRAESGLSLWQVFVWAGVFMHKSLSLVYTNRRRVTGIGKYGKYPKNLPPSLTKFSIFFRHRSKKVNRKHATHIKGG